MASGRHLLLAVALVASGCATNPTRRFAKATGYNDTAGFQAVASVSSSPASARPSMSLKDLPDQAAAAYITAIAAKTKTLAELQSALAKPIGGGSQVAGDETKLTRTLLVTVSVGCTSWSEKLCPTGKRPPQFIGDRLTYIELWIEPVNFTFSDIPAAATTWASQTIDTRDVSTDLKLQPELDLTLAGTAKGALKGPLSFDRQSDVKATDTDPYRLPTINLRSGSVVLEASGSRSVDLVGSAVINASVIPPATTDRTADPAVLSESEVVTDLSVGGPGAWLSEADARLAIHRVRTWKSTPLTAKLHFWYGVRHIKRGQATYPEDDDEVEFEDIQSPDQCVLIVPAYEVAPAFWSVSAAGANVGANTGGATRQVVFRSQDDAETFAGWLAAAPRRAVGGRHIGRLVASKGPAAGEARLADVDPALPILVVSLAAAVGDTLLDAATCLPKHPIAEAR